MLSTRAPPHLLLHDFNLLHNALPTSRRMRHMSKIAIDDVQKCFFCGLDQDSLIHIYTYCRVVNSARISFFNSLSLDLSSFYSTLPPFLPLLALSLFLARTSSHVCCAFFLPLSPPSPLAPFLTPLWLFLGLLRWPPPFCEVSNVSTCSLYWLLISLCGNFAALLLPLVLPKAWIG